MHCTSPAFGTSFLPSSLLMAPGGGRGGDHSLGAREGESGASDCGPCEVSAGDAREADGTVSDV